MTRRDTQRVALITGAGRGIGRATAEAFAAEGYTVVLAEIAQALGRRTERALARKGPGPSSSERIARVIVDLAAGRRREASGAAVDVIR